jgi:FtsH-binding integral membrane protein
MITIITATALHFACSLGIASGAGWLCGYADSFLELVWAMVPVFVLVYAVVYLSIFFAMKREAARINKALEAE